MMTVEPEVIMESFHENYTIDVASSFFAGQYGMGPEDVLGFWHTRRISIRVSLHPLIGRPVSWSSRTSSSPPPRRFTDDDRRIESVAMSLIYSEETGKPYGKCSICYVQELIGQEESKKCSMPVLASKDACAPLSPSNRDFVLVCCDATRWLEENPSKRCSNPKCESPGSMQQPIVGKMCSRCKRAHYCSKECQVSINMHASYF